MTKEERQIYMKEYRQKKKIEIAEQKKKYREANKENINEYYKEYYKDNKTNLDKKKIEYSKNAPQKTKDKIKQYQKEYRGQNRDKINQLQKERRKKDILYKISSDLRSMIGLNFRENNLIKNIKTNVILGCTFKEFKIHIENQFESWMNWDNRGNWNGIPTEINSAWDIDHIIPISTAKTEADIIRLNHYTNLQPLCSYINRYIKRDNI